MLGTPAARQAAPASNIADNDIAAQVGPSYHVLGDNTESLHIEFDPTVTSYSALLEFFWLDSRRLQHTCHARQAEPRPHVAVQPAVHVGAVVGQ